MVEFEHISTKVINNHKVLFSVLKIDSCSVQALETVHIRMIEGALQILLFTFFLLITEIKWLKKKVVRYNSARTIPQIYKINQEEKSWKCCLSILVSISSYLLSFLVDHQINPLGDDVDITIDQHLAETDSTSFCHDNTRNSSCKQYYYQHSNRDIQIQW